MENISALCPDISRYYGNRAACYMMLKQYRDALADAKKCIQLEPKFTKVCLLFSLVINKQIS